MLLLYNNGYPLECDEEVLERVVEQAEKNKGVLDSVEKGNMICLVKLATT